jgi:alkanesulfonate monooxygenase SsuD/methylene tetrahydromethanopterin reductase-like flavin-dependent oxidoreductase (luciferase family)
VLAGLAATVPRVRLGSLVCSTTYRHPAALANLAATVDRISGGRLVLGLGAGWQLNEHDAYGIELGSVKERLDRFEEACAVVTGLLRAPRTTVEGSWFRIVDAPCEPKPVQQPLPFLVGGGGERRTLAIAARYATEWNVWGTPEVLRHKNEVLDRHCEAIGRDPSSVRRTGQALVGIRDEPVQPQQGARPAVVGSPEQVAEAMAAYADAGVDEFIVPCFDTYERAGTTLERFMAEVVPLVR